MPVGFADMNAVTKRMYTGDVVEQLISETPLLKSKRKRKLELGSDVFKAIQTGWGQGIGVAADKSPLPTPGKPTFLNPTYTEVNQYAVLGITGQAWKKVSGDRRAFILLNKKLGKDAFTALFRDMEFQLFRDGTGVRGLVNAAVAAGANANVVVTSAYRPIFGFAEDMTVEFWDPTNTFKVTEARINDVDMVNGDITVDDLPAPLAGGEYIYRKGNRNGELYGLDYLVNDSTGPATVLGIASTQSKWQSRVYANGGVARDIAFNLCDLAYYSSMQQNGKPPDEVWMGYGQMTQFVALHGRNVEYQGSTRGEVATVNGRTKVLNFGNAECKLSSMCPEDKMHFLQSDDFALEELVPLQWITEEGASNIWMKKQGFHEFEATAWHAGQFVLGSRRLHSQVKDLTKVTL